MLHLPGGPGTSGPPGWSPPWQWCCRGCHSSHTGWWRVSSDSSSGTGSSLDSIWHLCPRSFLQSEQNWLHQTFLTDVWDVFFCYRQSCLDMQTQFFQMDASLSKREYCLGRNPFKVFNVEIHYSIKAPTGHGSTSSSFKEMPFSSLSCPIIVSPFREY